ncbi:MAG TPA: hypothetical protein VFZ52_01230 [Chryseolinea sp.]
MKYPFGILVLLCLMHHNFDGSAQGDFRPGYIIRNNEDSIAGFVSYGTEKSNTRHCFFKEKKNVKYTSFTAGEIKRYGFINDKTYVSMTLPHEWAGEIDEFPQEKVFLKSLVTGPLGLYRYQKYYLLEKNGLILLPFPTDIMIETESDGRAIKLDRRYIDVINSFIENAQLSANKAAYSEDDLTYLIEKYNVSQGHRRSIKSKPAIALGLGVTAGYVTSKLTMDYFDKGAFEPSSTIVGGVSLNISSPKVYDRLFFSVEGWYEKIFYQGYTEYQHTGDLVRQDMLIDISFFKTTLGLKYHLLGLHNTPYIKAGIAVYFLGNTSLTINKESQQFGNVIVTDTDPGENFQIRRPAGYWFAAGYDKNISRAINLFGEFRIEKNNGFVGTAVQSASSATDLSFLLGVRF